jgi:acyl-CoA synthetase (AMP-forming)/AMP-acid ligase II
VNDHPRTILDVLAGRSTSDAVAYLFLPDGTSAGQTRWTFRDVAARSAAFAAHLSDRGIRRDSRVVLAVNPGLEFIAAMFGIMAIGAIPVPSFPPLRPRELERFHAITVDCAPDGIVIDAMYRPAMTTLLERLEHASLVPEVCYLEDLAAAPVGPARTVIRHPGDLALIQYTSGSTGSPKGVCLTHDNLVSNCQALLRSMGPNPDRVVMSWLPPYHDMGLMGTIILTIFHGWPLVLMSPLHFIQEPRRWLQVITDFGVTTTVGPNFSLDLCTSALSGDPGLDLSSVNELYCGAEPVGIRTLAQFEAATAAYGFNGDALIPCYGMAEATLFISGKRRGTRYIIDETQHPIISCGDVDEGHVVRIVDTVTGTRVPDGEIGEIWVAGRNVAAGYYKRESLTHEVFHTLLPGDDRRYLRTGDLGFLRAGELYVTGRIKDLIIVNARNIYPHDVEASVGRAVPEVIRAVAFSVADETAERMVVLAETAQLGDSEGMAAATVEAIRTCVTAEFGVGPEIQLCPKRAIPTTTSGKVRRQEARRMYEAGELATLHGGAAVTTLSSVG